MARTHLAAFSPVAIQPRHRSLLVLAIGPLNAFLRDLLHILDGAVYIGYLWPLWHPRRQTFTVHAGPTRPVPCSSQLADQIAKTVAIDLRVDDPSTLTAATSGRPSPGSRHW
ncbi:hypothetical protein MLP_21370 [Microlunatus phosphovorus NM-1]|uniref:Uncharacterized protein n=1 Tax=Microlunatus phosphovorus (strain ATCC 700054 / DSM 10555 / JCM 9379 / NBRC 101784 / NCIMB 13414 / VKM Ac-1990 / NM-1) TaxID=1032480 RepID=F5XDX8_MICPN|nr:hypothetical protein MLP_21370 [Microlunatus phosphovorus NM-1]